MSTQSNTKQDQQKSLVLLSVGVLLIMLGLIGLRHYWGVRSYNSKVIEKSEEARDQAVSNKEAIKSLQSSLSDLEAGDFTSREVLDALPPKYDYAALFTSVDKLVLQNGLNLVSYSHDDISAQSADEASLPAPVELPLVISVEGNYENLQKLIDQLEKSIRPFQIIKMTISGTNNDMRATLDMVTYYQPSESEDKISTEVVEPNND